MFATHAGMRMGRARTIGLTTVSLIGIVGGSVWLAALIREDRATAWHDLRETSGAVQIADPQFDPSVLDPAYVSEHPRVAIDEAHRVFFTPPTARSSRWPTSCARMATRLAAAPYNSMRSPSSRCGYLSSPMRRQMMEGTLRCRPSPTRSATLSATGYATPARCCSLPITRRLATPPN